MRIVHSVQIPRIYQIELMSSQTHKFMSIVAFVFRCFNKANNEQCIGEFRRTCRLSVSEIKTYQAFDMCAGK